jgi:hypothetical protein
MSAIALTGKGEKGGPKVKFGPFFFWDGSGDSLLYCENLFPSAFAWLSILCDVKTNHLWWRNTGIGFARKGRQGNLFFTSNRFCFFAFFGKMGR